MAWTQALKLKSGTAYRGLYRDRDGKTCSAGTFPSKSVALEAARDAEPAATLTYREWWEQWEPIWPVKKSTKLNEGTRVRKHTLPKWGDTPLDKITRPDVKKWVAELNETLAASSVRGIVSAMSVAMDAAIDKELIVSNPCAKIKMKELPPTPDKYLSTEECDFIRGELKDDTMRLLYDILLWTGARWGEGVGLHGFSDSGDIPLKWSWSTKGLQYTNLKDHLDRSAPMSKHLVLPAPERNTLPKELYDGRRPFYGPVLGRVVTYREWRTAWTNATKDMPGVRTHDLRHTYASRLASAGVPLADIQHILGHSTQQMTERYARFMPTSHARAKLALDQFT